MFSAKYLSFVALVSATAVSAAPWHKQPQWPSGLSTYSEEVAAHVVTYCASGNDCTTQTLIDNVCTEVGWQMDNRMATFHAPPAGITCHVYADPYCGGQAYTIPAAGEWNVMGQGFQGNGVTNLMCTGSANVVSQLTLGHTIAYCKDPYATEKDNCQSQIAADGVCTEVPADYSGNIHAFKAPNGITCTLYDYYLCEDAALPVQFPNNPLYNIQGNNARTFKCQQG